MPEDLDLVNSVQDIVSTAWSTTLAPYPCMILGYSVIPKPAAKPEVSAMAEDDVQAHQLGRDARKEELSDTVSTIC
jgi:hypothetical protein